jgi:magnesium transporter
MRKIKYKKGRKVQPSFFEYTGIHKQIETEIQLFVYNNHDLTEFKEIHVKDLEKNIDLSKVNWLNIHGLNNLEIIKSVGEYLKVDNFMLGDILNTTKRTKLDEYQDVLFFNIKSLLPTENEENINVEQISFLLKNGVLTSFQEKRSDYFTHIRERIKTHSGIVREQKADYLLYLLLDAIMENFYITLENEEDKVEELINLSKTSTSPAILELIEKHRDNFNFD